MMGTGQITPEILRKYFWKYVESIILLSKLALIAKLVPIACLKWLIATFS